MASYSQVETIWIDTTTTTSKTPLFYFTNRPLIVSDSGWITFVDKYQYGTDTLTFGTYHVEKDSLAAKYRAIYDRDYIDKLSRKENFLY